MSECGVLEPGEKRRESARNRANNLVESAQSKASDAGRTVETVVESGNPADTILGYIDAQDVDRVVMGGHGGERNAIARRLLGTVATTVVGEAPVTVTVVR
jgi:nucleotide-binding universal stress UspA family protein